MAATIEAWPPHRTETRPWTTDRDARAPGGRRPPVEDRLPAEIHVAIPPKIAELTPRLSDSTIGALDAATAAITRLDAGAGVQLGALSGFLVRSESIATSKIERIDAGLDDLARASIGAEAGAHARQTMAAARAITGLIDESADGISRRGLLDAHRVLLQDDRLEGRHAGHLRTQQNWLGGSDFSPRGADYVPPNHERVPDAVDDLVAFMNRTDLPVVAQAAIAHAQFESIHPFTDGNGRIGRALINSLLRSRGLTRAVTVPVASVMLADVDTYFAHLDDYRAGDIDGITGYLATAAVTASDEAEVSARALAALPEGWFDAAGRPRRGAAATVLIGLLLSQPVVTHKLAADMAGTSERTAFTAIDRLVEAGVLVEITGNRRDRVWMAGDVFDELDRLQDRIGRRIKPNRR